MTAIQDIISEVKHALAKPAAEQEIALRVIESKLSGRLTELEIITQEAVVAEINSMIIDCIPLPGQPSEFSGKSHQDVLAILKSRVARRVNGFNPAAVTTVEVDQRIRTAKKFQARNQA